MIRSLPRSLFALVVCIVTTGLAAAALPAPPNIVFILIDDLGAADLQSDGAVLAETPALDQLRREGLSFSAAYAPAPICSASRSAFLTGRSPARLHFEFVTKPRDAKPPAGTALVQPTFPYNLPLGEVSLAELLGPAGYATGFFGKWHLTQDGDHYLAHGDQHGPRQQGFVETDEERGSHPYNYPDPNGAPPGPPAPDGEYEPDALTDLAIDFLHKHRSDRFFLQLCHYYVHEPVNTRCEWLLRKYRDKATRLGLPVDEGKVSYAAFVDVMDHLVGRVLAELDALDLTHNTLVIVTSDNGGAPQHTDNGNLRGSKWTLYEGGIRVPFFVRWPDVTRPGTVSSVPIIGTDIFPTLATVAHAQLPSDRPLDGVDLTPLLPDPTASLARSTLLWHFPFYHKPHVNETPVSALREGNLKIVHHYEGPRTELFDLAADPSEQHDLAGERPAEMQRLLAELMRQLNETGARFPKARTSKQ